MAADTQLIIRPQQRPRIYWAFRDTLVLITRSLKHIKQQPDQLIGASVQPVLLVVMFKFLFGGAISTGGSEHYIDFVIAGIFIENAVLTTVTASTGVATDMLTGAIDRFRTLPMLKSAILTGHVVATVCTTLVGTVVLVVAGLVFGFRPSTGLAGWLAVIGLTVLVSLALSWIAVVFGLIGKSIETAQQLGAVLVLPVIVSSAFVPTQTMPGWLRAFADNQPMTQAIDAIRALLLGQPVGDHVKLTLIWFGGITLVMYIVASLFFRQRTSS